MFTFRPGSLTQYVVQGSDEVWQWRHAHTFFEPGHEFSWEFKHHRWDGKRSPGQVLPTGEYNVSYGLFLRMRRDFGDTAPLDSILSSSAEQFIQQTPEFAKLRDYQRDAFELVLKWKWGRVAYATNAGKGAVIALLARYAVWEGRRALILCDERSVFDALVTEVRTWGQLEPYLLKSGAPKQPASNMPPVTIAMVPTLERRVKDSKHWKAWLRAQDMVLVDEADKADAPRWKHVFTYCSNSEVRAGFSGSFPTGEFDDLQMDELMGPIIARVRNEEMVARGVSARPEIEVHAFDSTPYVTHFPADFRDMNPVEKRNWCYEKVVFGNPYRHVFIGSLIRPETPTVIIVTRIEHGKVLAASLPNSFFLSGSASDKERQRVLDRFAAGELRVLIVTKILDRGTNRLGQAVDIIFASSEGSTSQVLQRIGRGLRRAGGKEFLRLVDIVDRIGPEQGDYRAKIAAAFFENAARKRLQVYATEGFDVSLVPYTAYVPQGGLLSFVESGK